MSHTPGPWHGYDNGFDGGVVSGWRLCEDPKCGQHYFEDRYGKPRQHYDEWIVGGEPHEGRLDPATPDARLIAAAPDLLAALEREHPKTVHAGFGIIGRADSGAYIHGPIDYGEGCETCAAIAKATGKEA